MYRLFHGNNHPSYADVDMEREVLELNHRDVYTSNELMILAARVALAKKQITQFILVQDDKEYYFNEYGRFSNGYPDSIWDKLLDELLFIKDYYEL